MNLETIKQFAREEVIHKNLGTTQQFLEVFTIKTENSEPMIARIDADDPGGQVVVYFPIGDERFYFVVYFDNDGTLMASGTEPGIRLYLWIYASPKITIDDLPFKPTQIGNKHFVFSVDRGEPDCFEDKFNALLQELEKYKKEMKVLASKTHMSLNVAYYGYKEEMWGIHFDGKMIKRLYDLKIDFDLDLYASGESLIS